MHVRIPSHRMVFHDDDAAPHFMTRDSKMVIFASNHVMVNRCRQIHGKELLTRSKFMDNIARTHALSMASQQLVFSMQDNSENQHPADQFGGENVHRGHTIQHIQDQIEYEPSCQISLQNVLSDDFTEFGMGTARGVDGQLYMCQLFR